MPTTLKPWKVVILPDGSCKILDENGAEIRDYVGFVAAAEALAKALRTITRLRRVSWPDRVDTFHAILHHPNPVVVEESGREKDDSDDGRPF